MFMLKEISDTFYMYIMFVKLSTTEYKTGYHM
jgi:hypothetical protein